MQRSTLKTLTDAADVSNAFQLATRLLYQVYPRQSPLGEPIPDWPNCARYTSHVLALHDQFEARVELLTPVVPLLLTELFCDCGVYLWSQGQYAQSEALAKSSIRLAKFALTDYDTLRAQPYTLLGCVYIRIEGKLPSALDCLQTALEIRSKHKSVVYSDSSLPLVDDIQLANALSNVAVVQKQAGDYEKAASLHQRALEIKMKYPVDQMAFLLALSYDNLGRVRELQGDLETAASWFAKGYSLLKAHSKETGTHHRMAQFTCSLGRVEAKLGQNMQAQNHLWEALKLYEETVGAFHTDAGLASYYLGSLSLKEGAIEHAM